MPSSLATAVRALLASAMVGAATAQVPNPARYVHPSIADPTVAFRYGPAPLDEAERRG
mgnify:CR=1 FL=1